jgi:hypothetical protein
MDIEAFALESHCSQFFLKPKVSSAEAKSFPFFHFILPATNSAMIEYLARCFL